MYSESELKNRIIEIYQEERLNLLNEKWSKLSGKDRTFVLEFLKVLYPEKSILITEARWYNTLGDIVGIFDPTGVVDIVNGISYWRQGDKLFAILSWVSVIPYLGDLIAKPVIGIMKLGGATTKAFKAAVLAGDASKIASAAKKSGGPILKMVEKAPTWGTQLVTLLRNSVGRVPGLGKGFVNTVEEYVKIFQNASKEMKASKEITGKLVSKAKKEALTASEKQLLANELKKQSQFSGFSKYKGEGQTFKSKYLAGGMGRLWGNRATRSLMRRTKWYLGLLDFLGFANFVGPDELETKFSDIESKINEYNKTENAQQYAQEEFGGLMGGFTPPKPPSSPSKEEPTKYNQGMDAVTALASLFGGK